MYILQSYAYFYTCIQTVTACVNHAYWPACSALGLLLFVHCTNTSLVWQVYYSLFTGLVAMVYLGAVLLFTTLSWWEWWCTVVQFWSSLYLVYLAALIGDCILSDPDVLLPLRHTSLRRQGYPSYGSTKTYP